MQSFEKSSQKQVKILHVTVHEIRPKGLKYVFNCLKLISHHSWIHHGLGTSPEALTVHLDIVLGHCPPLLLHAVHEAADRPVGGPQTRRIADSLFSIVPQGIQVA